VYLQAEHKRTRVGPRGVWRAATDARVISGRRARGGGGERGNSGTILYGMSGR